MGAQQGKASPGSGIGFAAAMLASLLLASAWPVLAAPSYEHAAETEGLAFARAGDRVNEDVNFLEIMGGGACWLDFDADGDQDLFLVNGWYNDTALAAARQPRSVLYRNDGPRPGADFTDATDAAGLNVQGWTQACAAADYDADGLEDLLVIGYGIQTLLRNQGGRFTDTTASSGISALGKCPQLPCWGSGAAWADYDRDGCLDVYVINFVAFNVTKGGPRGPLAYDGQPNQLYRSNCDGTFEDVTAESGTDGDPGPEHSKNWGVTWLDYDLDGWLDIYVASDGTPNILYRNDRDGTFTDTALEAGVADARNGMGLSSRDCDDDGDEELFFTHYNSFPGDEWWGYDGFFVNEANGTFTDHSGEGDLSVTMPYIKWGVDWEDLDNDGDLDLHVATGHTESFSPMVPDMPHLLWTGDGACHWTDARAAAGDAIGTKRMSRGTATADWDLDGILDIVTVNIIDEATELLRGTGSDGHWLSLELRQPGGNARAVGAEVRVEVPGGEVQRLRFMPYVSIHSSSAAQLHVGLGDATMADVTVTWPQDRASTRYEDLPADRILRLHRGGAVQDDTFPPMSGLAVEGGEGEEGWWRGAVTVSLEATDRVAGAAAASGVLHRYLSVDGAAPLVDPAPLALAEGPHSLRWWSTDAAGNAELARTAFVGRDATAPASTATLDGDLQGGWYQGPVRATLACFDAGSGVGRMEWRLDEDAWKEYDGPFDLTRPGQHTFTSRCVDKAGNSGAEVSQVLAIDLGHPETLPLPSGPRGLAGWWTGPVTVAIDAAGGSRAVISTLLGVDGGPLEAYAGPVVLSTDGIHTLRFRSTDAEGNAEPERAFEVRIDATPPRLRLTDEGPHLEEPWAMLVGPRNLLRPVGEDAGSGLASLESKLDWEPFLRQRPFILMEEGLHHVTLRGADAAGNAVTWERSVFVDLTAPSLAIVRPGNNTLHVSDAATLDMPLRPPRVRAVLVGSPTLEAAVGEDISGIAELRFIVDEVVGGRVAAAPWTWRWSFPPAPLERFHHAVTFVVEDRVGNVRAVGFEVYATGDAGGLLGLETTPLPGLLSLVVAGALGLRRLRPRWP